MSVAEDASTPAVAVTAGGAVVTTLASASFTPPAGSVLVALCAVNWGTFPGVVPGITVTDSASGTWTPGPVISLASAGSKVAAFTRPVAAAPAAITVTMSRGADNTAAMLMLAARVCGGAADAPQGASNTASGLGTGAGFQVAVTLTPTAIGSLLYVITDHADTNANTVIAGTTTLQATTDSTDGGLLAAGKSSAVTGSLASQVLGWTASIPSTDGFVAAALEILPAGRAPAALVVPQAAVMQAASW